MRWHSSDEPRIEREHFPCAFGVAPVSANPPPMTRQRIVRDAIEATLRSCAGNVSEAARRLGVGRGTIYRTIKGSRS